MVYDMSGVDVFFLVKELKTLEGSKVDKIVQIDKKLFLFRFFLNKEKTNLRLLVPELVNITNQKYESPLLPLGFCSFLRKYLQNTRLKKVYQRGFERIIVFEFESAKYGQLVLLLELFKPGNMILCKKDEETNKLIILNSLERQEFKDRKVEARQEYIFPPEKNNPLSLSAEELKKTLSKSDKVLGKVLATDLSLGGTYAEEIITRTGLDKTNKNISINEAKELTESINAFFLEKINCAEKSGKIYPVNMKSIVLENKFESFNQGLDSLIVHFENNDKKSKEVKHKKSKTSALLEIQTKRILALEKEVKEAQACGEFIYENYQEFQKLLLFIKEMRDQGKSYDEIELVLQKNKHFKKLDKANKKIHLVFNK